MLDASASNFKIADLQNNNEYDISWEKLIQIFPALDGKRDLFKWKEYNEDEELVNPSDIRNKIMQGDDSWKNNVDEKIHGLVVKYLSE